MFEYNYNQHSASELIFSWHITAKKKKLFYRVIFIINKHEQAALN